MSFRGENVNQYNKLVIVYNFYAQINIFSRVFFLVKLLKHAFL